jgi:FKBP-type peptidyl-prolyl cis-trans isomerase
MNRSALFAAVLSLAVGTGLAACSHQDATLPAATSSVAALETTDLVAGAGAEAVAGSRVTVHYTGWLHDPAQPAAKGAKFDSSRDSGQPFSFTLGKRQVIAGWDRGVQGMKVGGQRRLVIPPALAYGDRGAGGVIPPGAALIFDVELLAVDGGR